MEAGLSRLRRRPSELGKRLTRDVGLGLLTTTVLAAVLYETKARKT